MSEVALPLVGPSNITDGDCQRSINLFPKKGTKAGERPCMVSGPGLASFAALDYSPVRGTLVMNGRLFIVAGQKVIEVNSVGGSTIWGALGSVRGRVTMDFNGDTIVIGDGTGFYSLNLLTAAMLEIADAPIGRWCRSFNQRILYQERDSGRVYYSELNDPTNVPPLNFFTAENRPDDLATMLVTEDQIWLLGLDGTEVFYDSGDGDNPFQRIQGSAAFNGCHEPETAVRTDSSLLWVGKNDDGFGQVFRNSGFQHIIVSTNAVERFLKTATNLSAYSYQEDGRTFYIVNADQGTWAFDLSTNQWHERAATSNGVLTRWRGEIHAFCYGKHLVSDKTDATIWEQSTAIYADGANPLVKRRVFRGPLSADRDVSINALHVEMNTGVGLITGQGSDPQMMLRSSIDGGQLFDGEQWASIGAIGDRNLKVRYHRLGLGSDWVFELTVTDPVPVTMFTAFADAVPGRR